MCVFLEDCFPIILGSTLSILGGCFTTLWSSRRERKERLWESKRQEYNNAIRIVRIIRESLEKIRVGAAGSDGSDEERDKETLQGFENAYSAINSNLYETLLKLKMLGNDAIVCEFDKLGKIVMDFFRKCLEDSQLVTIALLARNIMRCWVVLIGRWNVFYGRLEKRIVNDIVRELSLLIMLP